MSNSNFRNISFIIVLLFLLTVTYVYLSNSKPQDLPTYVDLFHTTQNK